MTITPGILYGIGVGPGDPELITLKALRILERVPYVFAAASTKNDYSLALNIVRHYIAQAVVEPLIFPHDFGPPGSGGGLGARMPIRCWRYCSTGEDAAFLTIGDPLTYSTYGYLLKTVKTINPDIKAITVPGHYFV